MVCLYALCNRLIYISLLIAVGAVHFLHVRILHENGFNFSDLSQTEREMSFISEQAFYYSFYKRLINEQPYVKAVVNLMQDKMVEHPDEINSFSRFNIYPEFLIASAYRYLEPTINSTKYRQCHLVNRGGSQAAVVSCVGIGDPMYFYLETVWIIAGMFAVVLTASACLISGSIAGGLLTGYLFLANHGEATRVMHSPVLRESFGLPLLFLQMLLVSAQLRRPTSVLNQIAIFITIAASLMVWQFSQFVLLTQLAVLFFMEQVRIIESKTFFILLHTHFCGIHMAILLLQGSEMLKTSLYISFFTVLAAYSLLFSTFQNQVITKKDLYMRILLIFTRISLAVLLSLKIRVFLAQFLQTDEDSHIFDIFRAKFSNYSNFHTKLYLCLEVFNFIPLEYFWNVSITGLLPLVVFGVLDVVYEWYISAFRLKNYPKNESNHVEAKYSDENLNLESKDLTGHETEKYSNMETTSIDKNLDSDSENVQQHDTNFSDQNILNSKTENSEILEQKIFENLNFNDIDSKILKLTQKTEDISEDNFGIDCVKEKIEQNEQIENSKRVDLDDLECKNVKSIRYDPIVSLLRKTRIDACIFYYIAQGCVFAILAILIMRLKCLFTPHLCVLASLAAINGWQKVVKNRWYKLLAIGLSVYLLSNGKANIEEQHEEYAEYLDENLEELIEWIQNKTTPWSAFAGPMATMAAVHLITGRPIVNHPHYEHKQMRERTYNLHRVYGRIRHEEMYDILNNLKVSYLVLTTLHCNETLRDGCTYMDIMEDESRAHPQEVKPLCARLLSSEKVPHLYSVFENDGYAVFRVHDYSVSYAPKFLAT